MDLSLSGSPIENAAEAWALLNPLRQQLRAVRSACGLSVASGVSPARLCVSGACFLGKALELRRAS